MMNKQEAIEKIEELKKYSCGALGDDWISLGIDKALNVVKQLDEPEKPVVPQFVADMITFRKNQGDNLVATLVNLGAFGDAQRWIRHGNNGDTFAKAWLFGYEVEKEKLYTVSLKKNGIGIGVQQQDGSFKEQFTKTELSEYGFDNLGEYEVKEVGK